MDRNEIVKETLEGTAMAKAPVVAGGTVSVITIFGVSLPDIVYILTAISLAISIVFSLWKFRRDVLKDLEEHREDN